ncbi:N-acetyltransferase ESCO [Trypanosoma melophagium]|uniref:N-acetyltransferase ESCO n=1 Tax=Trypanosoma melophagium TaxID=715481 RepID=UPI00351A6947|nr:N-acetyltransferase ESCO [Trypanosoma melophagium]
MDLSSFSSLFKEDILLRKKRRRQQDIHDTSTPDVNASCIENSFSLSVMGLRRWLLCPPCRVYESVTATNTVLQCAVLPGFFALQSERVKASARRRARGSSSTTCCKAALRTLLTKALNEARQTIGAVDEISNDSLLVVAFAGTTTPTSRHDNSIEDFSCRDSLVNSSSFSLVNGEFIGLSASLRPTQRLGLVGLCVARELSVAYRLHCKKTSLSLSSPLSVSTSKPSTTTTSSSIATTSGGTTSAPYVCNEKNDNHWEQDTTEVGNMWCVGSSLCGIQFFWVSDAHRRSGIATMLVELARQNVSYGFEIPVEHVAFSEPTVYGKLFARKYTGRPDFLVF